MSRFPEAKFTSNEHHSTLEKRGSRPIVIKLGGDNMSSANNIRKSADIVVGDPSRRLVVVSAAGKRFKDDRKVTWLLEDCGRAGSLDEFETAYTEVVKRHIEIAHDLFGGNENKIDKVNGWLNEARRGILERKDRVLTSGGDRDLNERRAIEYSSSRGERLMGEIFTEYLRLRRSNASFVDATEFMRVKDGQVAEKTYDLALQKLLTGSGIDVLPGFYGLGEDGEIATLGHGASDTTGAAIARSVGAQRLEIFKELLGVYSINPKEHPEAGARLIPTMSYDEMQEAVIREPTPLHRDAVLISQAEGIPINVRSFGAPDQAGTFIVNERRTPEGCKPIIVTGRNGYSALTVDQHYLDPQAIFRVFAEQGIVPDHSPSTPTSVTVVFEREGQRADLTKIIGDIESLLKSGDGINFRERVQIVSAIGDGMRRNNPLANYRILGAVRRAGLDYIDQTSRRGGNSLTLIVPEGQTPDPVEVIHEKCVYKGHK